MASGYTLGWGAFAHSWKLFTHGLSRTYRTLLESRIDKFNKSKITHIRIYMTIMINNNLIKTNASYKPFYTTIPLSFHSYTLTML